MKKCLLGSCLLGLLFMGCATPYSEAPVATNFANSEQNKLQSSAHWEVIANHLAKQIADSVGKEHTVYVNPTEEKSKFNTALHSLLLSALVKNEVKVAKFSATSDVAVDIKTQVVKFTPDRAPYRNMLGAPTLLAAGVWAMMGVGTVNTTANTVAAGVTSAAVGLDVYHWFSSRYSTIPEHEIIITVSASDATKYLSSISAVYYIADSDKSLYYTVPKGEKISITGDKQ